MKQIIGGKMYDTTTAIQICFGLFGRFNNKIVTLYQKLNGEFFELHELNEFGFRQWIVPVSEAEAMEFAEQEMSVDEYESVFGEVSE